nr:FdtA/QdtA family cupin domain-containing protein [uncultured Clostridium sp.]
MKNTSMIKFHSFKDQWGALTPLEQFKEIPFEVKRIYYIYDVPGDVRRGYHSHRDLHQVLICVHGSVTIQVKTPFEMDEIILDNPQSGLVIGPMVWREMYNFSEGAVLLVLASEYYTASDYMRDYEDYVKEAKDWFTKR